MGTYRYQFTGVEALPAKVTPTSMWRHECLSFSDACELIEECRKDVRIASFFTKPFTKAFKGMLDNLKLVTSADHDLTSFGYTIQEVTGCALEVPHGRAPQPLVLGIEQWESYRDNMYQKKKMVEDLCTILLEQPVSFAVNEKQDFEYWY